MKRQNLFSGKIYENVNLFGGHQTEKGRTD